MSPAENNLGRGDLPSLTFTSESVTIRGDRTILVPTSKIVWGAGSAWSVEEIITSQNTDNATQPVGIAAAWLQNYRFMGDEMSAECPMHLDRRPSFGVKLVSGAWICRTGCGAGGLAWLVAIATGCSMNRCQEWLAGAVRMMAERTDSDDYSEDGPDRDDEFANEFMHKTVPPDRQLSRRRISTEAASELDIRWQHGWLLPMRHLRWSYFMGSQHKSSSGVYSDAPKRLSMFGIGWWADGDTAIVVESPLDVAVLRSAGLEGGLATYGKPSRTHLRFLAERAGDIVLAFDNDEARQKYLADAISSGYLDAKVEAGEVFRWWYSDSGAKDPGEQTEEQLLAGIRQAEQIRLARFARPDNKGHR